MPKKEAKKLAKVNKEIKAVTKKIVVLKKKVVKLVKVGLQEDQDEGYCC